MSVTMKDIAKKAGVARTTVSMVLNNNPASYVSKVKKEKILKIARDLNYRPNYSAISLRQGKTNCIGLLSSQALNYRFIDNLYYFGQISTGIQEGIVENGARYSMITFGTDLKETYGKSLELIQQRNVDGLVVILMSFELDQFEKEQLPILNSLNIPFVAVHSTGKELPYNNVGINAEKGGYLAAEHFIKLGYDDIAFLMQNPEAVRLQEMLAGFKQAFADHSRTFSDDQVITPNPAPGTTLPERFCSLPTLPRAVFVPNDNHARDIIRLLHEKSTRVPEDNAVIGFNNIVTEGCLYYGLTTVRHPVREKGLEACRILTGLLDGKLDKDKVYSRILDTELVVRTSCGSK